MSTSPSTQWLNPYIHMMTDQSITDFFFNGPDHTYFLKEGQYKVSISPFTTAEQMQKELQQFAFSTGTRLDTRCPFAGGILRKGEFRWHCIIQPASPQFPTFTVRRMAMDLKKLNFIDKKLIYPQLVSLIEQKENLIFCGSTGSGKTTVMHKLLEQCCRTERVVSVEDIEELRGSSKNWVRLCSKAPDIEQRGEISFATILSEAMRLRPDRIVCGEIRSHQSYSYLEMLLTGHKGSLATIHADCPEQVRQRLQSHCTYNILSGLEIWICSMKRGDPPEIKDLRRITFNS